MTLQEQQMAWKRDITGWNVKKALEDILARLDSNCPQINQLHVLIGRFNDGMRGDASGAIMHENFTTELSRIRSAALHFIDTISESDLKANYLEKDKTDRLLVENKILVLSDEGGIYTLKQYFNTKNFSHLTFDTWDNFNAAALNDVEIVILNNMDLPPMHHRSDEAAMTELVRNRENIIKQAVATSECYFVHYGLPFYLVSEYPNRLIATNFIFTLFSRVREIADFANTYKIKIQP